MISPDYDGGSIVNLMCSIAKSFGVRTHYPSLRHLPPKKLKGKNVVLLLIDGMGYEFLMRQEDSFLKQACTDTMTSVFPSHTAACITSLATATAPQQHAVTGWYMFLKETGSIATILPFRERHTGAPLDADIRDLIGAEPVLPKMNGKTAVIQSSHIADSTYSNAMFPADEALQFTTLTGFMRQIGHALRGKERTFIYAYWSDLDALSHDHGHHSEETYEHFSALDKAIARLVRRHNDTVFVITADHGLVDTPKNEDKPVSKDIKDCLTLPICGGSRMAYCYVRPQKKSTFESLMKKEKGELWKSSDLIKKGYLGKGKADRRLLERLGDYCFLPAAPWILKDHLINEEEKETIGHHGGLSEEEMLVPFILLET